MPRAGDLAPLFHALFTGMQKAHGTYNAIAPDKTRLDGKLKGQAFTVRKPVTDALWEEHLKGKNGIGIIPIREDNSACFGAIDIDVYDGLDPVQIAAKLKELNLPLVVCRSKSGGVHVYLFARMAVPAAKMVDRLRDIAAKIGHGKAEIFPKQIQVSEGERDLAGWINVPYFLWDSTDRYAVNADGLKLSAEAFLDYAEECKVDPGFFPEPEDPNGARKPRKELTKGEKALPDGPPCLQHLIDTGIGGSGSNTILFNLGIYYRKAHPDWVTFIESANSKLLDPSLPAAEVNAMIGQHKKKSYLYQCKEPALAPHCNQTKCRLRKYGIGGGAHGFPTILEVRKLETDPPAWFLDMVDPRTDVTKTIELTIEELVDARLFQLKCANYIGILPIMPQKVVWQQLVGEMICNATTMEPLPPEASGAEGQFWEFLEEFCTDRAQAQERSQVTLGMPYTETDPDIKTTRTYFRTKDMVLFLKRKHFTDLKIQQIAKILRKNKDVKRHTWHIPNCVQLWSIPAYERIEVVYGVPESVTNGGEKQF